MPERIYDKDNHFDRLKALMDVLRENCPWDKAQTLASLRRYTLEETHEVLEAIDIAGRQGDWTRLRHELGDLLIQVAFYARIAEEQHAFTLADVVDSLIERMVARHPHVFADAAPENLTAQWNELKDAEHAHRESLMDDVPPLPALARALKLQDRAARVGFDWRRATDVLAKIEEELAELRQAVEFEDDAARIEDEFGDVLFTLVNLGRKLGVDSEVALMGTNRKFAERFRCMESLAKARGLRLQEMDTEALEALYDEAKTRLRS